MSEKVNVLSNYSRDIRGYQLSQLDLITEWLKTIEVKTVLDAGCGIGTLTLPLKDTYQWTGIDISPAVENFHSSTAIARLDRLPFADQSFDAVLCVDVLEHLPESYFDGALQEMARVARKAVLIVVPCEPSLKTLSLVCPRCGAAFHHDGHVRQVTLERMRPHLEAQRYSLAKTADMGDQFPDSPSAREVLFQKRFWEQLLSYQFECPDCGIAIKDCLTTIPPVEEFLDVHYRILAPQWFNAMKDRSIKYSEKGFIWIKGEAGYFSDKQQTNPCCPFNVIDPSCNECILESPYALPYASYIVLDRLIEQKVRESGGAFIPLPPGTYRIFLAGQCSGLRIYGSAENTACIELRWLNRDDCWLTMSFNAERGREFEHVINFHEIPKLELEGAYIELNLSTGKNSSSAGGKHLSEKEAHSGHLISLRRIEGIAVEDLSYTSSRCKNSTEERPIWPSVFSGQNTIISHLFETRYELKRTYERIGQLEELLERTNQELERWVSANCEAYSMIEMLEKKCNKFSYMKPGGMLPLLRRVRSRISRLLPERVKTTLKSMIKFIVRK
ncbi:MAG: class I SAM-dependent methyltransferase [Vulcanimicrobiota bacterium]